MRRELIHGLAAGVAGTTALNAVTFLDMVLRARPASTTPEASVRKAEDVANVPLSAEGSDSDAASNRRSGLGSILGITTGLGMGALYGVVRPRLARDVPMGVLAVVAGLGATAGSMAPMTLLGVTDPREWSASSWLSDLVPHLAYGAVTAAVFEALEPRSPLR